PPANASASRVQARPEREGDQKRAGPQKAEGKRHHEPVVAKLVFADQMARLNSGSRTWSTARSAKNATDRPSDKRAAIRWTMPSFIISNSMPFYRVIDAPVLAITVSDNLCDPATCRPKTRMHA